MMNEREYTFTPHLTAEEATAAIAQQLPDARLKLTGRELSEIKHAMLYARECNHGTTGHNQLILIAKLAEHLGMGLEMTDGIPVFEVSLPDGVEIVAK